MIKTISSQIGKAAKQVRQSFLAIVARGGSQQLQLKGLPDEVLQEVELVQHVGFSSHIPEGARVVLLPQQGKTARAVVIASTAAAVMVVAEEKETLIYDQFGHVFKLGAAGASLNCDLAVGGKITATGDITSEANVSAAGDVSDATGSMQDMRDQYNGHKHGGGPVPDLQME